MRKLNRSSTDSANLPKVFIIKRFFTESFTERSLSKRFWTKRFFYQKIRYQKVLCLKKSLVYFLHTFEHWSALQRSLFLFPRPRDFGAWDRIFRILKHPNLNLNLANLHLLHSCVGSPKSSRFKLLACKPLHCSCVDPQIAFIILIYCFVNIVPAFSLLAAITWRAFFGAHQHYPRR